MLLLPWDLGFVLQELELGEEGKAPQASLLVGLLALPASRVLLLHKLEAGLALLLLLVLAAAPGRLPAPVGTSIRRQTPPGIPCAIAMCSWQDHRFRGTPVHRAILRYPLTLLWLQPVLYCYSAGCCTDCEMVVEGS